MFGNRENVFAMVAGFAVRVKDEREQDRNHLIEVNYEIPLTFDLADEILPAMAKDLFMDVNGSWQPKPEIQQSIFNLSPAPQVMTVRTHPELSADIAVPGVTLRKISAKKVDAGTFMLCFTATWTLGDRKEAVSVIDRLKLGVYLTFVEQQRTMDLQPEVVAGTVVDVATDGTVATMKPAAGKGRKRKPNPANEYQAPTTNCPSCKVEIPGTVETCPLCGSDIVNERTALPPASSEGGGDGDTPAADAPTDPVH